MGPVVKPLVGSTVLAVIGGMLQIVPFIAIAEIAGELLDGGSDPDRLRRLGRLAVMAVGLSGLCIFVAGIVSHLADNDLQLSIRQRIATHLRRVPLGWFSATTSGEVKKAATDDVMTMHHLVAHAVLELAAAATAPVIAIVYLALIDWQLTLVVCIPLVVGIALYGAMMSRAGEMYRDYDVAMGRLNAAAVEFVQGIAVVKTFGEPGRAHRRFLDEARAYIERFWSMVRSVLGISAASEVVLSPACVFAFTLAAATLFVDRGWISAVDSVPFALLSLGITAPILALTAGGEQLRQAVLARRRIEGLLDTPQLPIGAAAATPADSGVGFHDVSFTYGGDAEQGAIAHALVDIDLRLPPGSVTALVGPSGSGKTTLARLAARFWDPTAGTITLGGVDLRELAPEVLYRHVGMVFQDVQLLRASIAANIALGRPDAGHAEIEAAARAARIHDRIVALPAGYRSIVGVDVTLSGGEAQRVSIARALLADTPVLVLDEATAFADPESESEIQDAISELVAGRTMLVIAHRLHTITAVDQIVVLDHGRIVEVGRHDELLAAGGMYRRLWDLYQRTADWQPHQASAESPERTGPPVPGESPAHDGPSAQIGDER